MTVSDYFNGAGGVTIESLSAKLFNRAAWPDFQHWRELEKACKDIVAKHGDLPFAGYRTLGMLMGWAMQQFTKATGQQVPRGWYPCAKQLNTMPGEPIVESVTGQIPTLPPTAASMREYYATLPLCPDCRCRHEEPPCGHKRDKSERTIWD